jgi:hypothetical protein
MLDFTKVDRRYIPLATCKARYVLTRCKTQALVSLGRPERRASIRLIALSASYGPPKFRVLVPFTQCVCNPRSSKRQASSSPLSPTEQYGPRPCYLQAVPVRRPYMDIQRFQSVYRKLENTKHALYQKTIHNHPAHELQVLSPSLSPKK